MKSFSFLLDNKREEKPRDNGITMVLDKGLALETAEGLMQLAGEYVDLLKFGWGTSIVYDRDILKSKIRMYQSYDITPYTGGTLFELAYLNDCVDEFFQEAHDLGFEAIEISDGTVPISSDEKLNHIEKAKNDGFLVFSEIGKKDPLKDRELSLENRVDMMNAELEAGSSLVIVEARESGKNIGIFDENGNAKNDEISFISENVDNKRILWESPNKNQQVFFVLRFGPNVNLGNISTEDIISLETIRRGFRGDTLGKL